jgi:hypothetical protein
MVKPRAGLLALLVLAALVAAWPWLARRDTPAPGAPARGGRAARAGVVAEIPRIDLARLTEARAEAKVGRRDLFGFGAVVRPPAPGQASSAPATLAAAPPETVPTGPPPPPPLNIKYIGNLESKAGLKVAVLLTDRREVLTGQVGELVANRFRIVKIGLESVDIQEVADGRVRRIPLRGN